MSDVTGALQEQHRRHVSRMKRGPVDEGFVDEVHALIAKLQEAGAIVADPAERSQVRALLRFWGHVVYDQTGVYPDTTLQPLDPGRVPALEGEEPSRRRWPSLVWMLVGGAAAAIIAAGLVLVGWFSLPRDTAVETPTLIPTPTPLPFVSRVAVGMGLGEDGGLESATDTFCLGVADVVAEVALEGVEPEALWRWEVQRAGEVVAASAATPWGEDERHVVRPLQARSEGVEPGRYELLIYAGEHVVGAHSFRVLDVTPGLSNLQVADVPESSGEAPGGPGERVFEPGVRVIYLSYDYEGFCPGLGISHVLSHEGEPLRESVGGWSGAPQGRAQVAFQAPAGGPFSLGSYEVTVTGLGQEPARVAFRIGEVEQVVSEEVSPAFGDIAIALGVQPDGTPTLDVPDGGFDWNTKVVYAVFEYEGMTDSLPWSALWMRNGEEIARQERLWDMETAGTAGTHWIARYDELGQVLPGGSYSVTVYIENVAQRTASFDIRYYVPPE